MLLTRQVFFLKGQLRHSDRPEAFICNGDYTFRYLLFCRIVEMAEIDNRLRRALGGYDAVLSIR
jgi:hypothetical protein